MMVKSGATTPLPTDKLFEDSPDLGTRDCICSRCGSQIQAMETCIRVWTTNDKDEVHELSKEYRYCEKCMCGVAFFNCQLDLDFGSRCKEQCDDCKAKPKDWFE